MELPAQMLGTPGPEQYGEEQAESEEAKAQAIIAEELRWLRWMRGEASARPKGAAEKLGLAVRLRAETTMTLGCITERVRMGSRE